MNKKVTLSTPPPRKKKHKNAVVSILFRQLGVDSYTSQKKTGFFFKKVDAQ